MGATATWREGVKITPENIDKIPSGTAIATFVNGEYPVGDHPKHAALFVRVDEKNGVKGAIISDQFKRDTSGKPKPAGERFIPFGGKSGLQNNLDKYSVIRR
jgi:hypothetical protein